MTDVLANRLESATSALDDVARARLLALWVVRAELSMRADLPRFVGPAARRRLSALIEAILQAVGSGSDDLIDLEADAWDLMNEFTDGECVSVGLLMTLICMTVVSQVRPGEKDFSASIEQYVSLASEWFLDRRCRWAGGVPDAVDYAVADLANLLESWRLIVDVEWLVSVVGPGDSLVSERIRDRAAQSMMLSALPRSPQPV